MIEEYIGHNLFRRSVDDFIDNDPQLSLLKGLKFVYHMDWWKGIDWNVPGIYLLTGGRQLGKTTSTKLLIKDSLLNKRFKEEKIFYLPCDQIKDFTALGETIRSFIDEIDLKDKFLLIIDEVTYVHEWDRAIKAIADEGKFRNGFCIITGSDTIIIKEAISRFPGRRGEAEKTDFHIMPLDFCEYMSLVKSELLQDDKEIKVELFDFFDKYLKCGGHLRAINDLYGKGAILPSTYKVFEQWIIGDFQKREKSISNLKRVLKALVETGGSQVTYSSLAERVGEMSKPTFIDYCDLLDRLDVQFNLKAFDQNRKIGFPNKARKFHFWDPFILDTVRRWLESENEISNKNDVELEPLKVESIVASHFMKRGPAFYLRGKGEVDVVGLYNKKPVFVEVKWTKQVRSSDVSELRKMKDSIILGKSSAIGTIEGIRVIPLPHFLLHTDKYLGEMLG